MYLEVELRILLTLIRTRMW